ncbi:hypothetical protein CEXT_513621, partial [Caerostris extrusa]
ETNDGAGGVPCTILAKETPWVVFLETNSPRVSSRPDFVGSSA